MKCNKFEIVHSLPGSSIHLFATDYQPLSAIIQVLSRGLLCWHFQVRNEFYKLTLVSEAQREPQHPTYHSVPKKRNERLSHHSTRTA